MHDLMGETNRRILVIDDVRSIHDDFRKILCGRRAGGEVAEDESILFGEPQTPAPDVGFEVDSAFQGQEGLAKVIEAQRSGFPYSLAFVDMRMPPGWDGLETITRLWEADPQLQIVICSAFSDYSWTEIARKLACPSQLLILKKPFDNAEVAQLATSLAEKWSMARRLEFRMDELERTINERARTIVQARQETESLLEAISSVMIGLNEEGVVHRWNKSAEEILGISSADAVGKALEELAIEWENRDDAMQLIGNAGTGVAARRSVNLVRNGTTRVLELSVFPVAGNGQRHGTLCLGNDITSRCQLEQQLRQSQKLESVGQLAAGIAHEINTPMQYVGDNLEFLRNKMSQLEPVLETVERLLHEAGREGLTEAAIAELLSRTEKLSLRKLVEQTAEAIEDSRDGVQHVSRIVRAMKQFAHPGQDDKAPVDINRAIESTIAVSTNEWKYVATIESSLDPSNPLVPGFAGELNQVFLNILVNAAHAIGETNKESRAEKGKITIATRELADGVEVAISDTGIGMTEQVKQRIFDPFFTTKEIGKGTGQGLAIAYSVVVNKHGGSILCESAPGVGTTFRIRLPLESSQVDDSQGCQLLNDCS